MIGGCPTWVRLVLEANLAKAVGFMVGVILLALVATFGYVWFKADNHDLVTS